MLMQLTVRDFALIDKITLDFDERLNVLTGETGAGKTTIAKSIMRILPDPPAHVRSGQVVLQGRDLMKLNEADMRKVRGKEISMIFQDPMTALNPTMRIGDQIAEVIRLHDKVTKAESMQKAQKMLETVGITAERYGQRFGRVRWLGLNDIPK